jgi:hypothetical protein
MILTFGVFSFIFIKKRGRRKGVKEVDGATKGDIVDME